MVSIKADRVTENPSLKATHHISKVVGMLKNFKNLLDNYIYACYHVGEFKQRKGRKQ